MTGYLRSPYLVWLLAFFLLLLPTSSGAAKQRLNISSPEQLQEDFRAVPCKDEERLEAVRVLFAKAGAAAAEMTTDKYKNVENFVIVKPGETAERIVVGAHYDKVSDGCGALDNWTGVVALAHIYRTLKDVPLKKTLVFAAFGKEEKGLIGSRAMANKLTAEQAAQHCAMINIDSLGLAAPQVAENMSSRKLGQFVAGLAKEMQIPFGRAGIEGADSDSTSFKAKKIPAVTIHGLNNDWPNIIHSRKDQASKINSASVYLGYRLALATIARLDDSLCAEYR
jgi:Iap family predicted aminopeptidase